MIVIVDLARPRVPAEQRGSRPRVRRRARRAVLERAVRDAGQGQAHTQSIQVRTSGKRSVMARTCRRILRGRRPRSDLLISSWLRASAHRANAHGSIVQVVTDWTENPETTGTSRAS